MEKELHHQTATFEKIHATLDRITKNRKKPRWRWKSRGRKRNSARKNSTSG